MVFSIWSEMPFDYNAFFVEAYTVCFSIHVGLALAHPSLGPRPKTNPSADHFQYCVIYAPDEVWGQD